MRIEPLPTDSHFICDTCGRRYNMTLYKQGQDTKDYCSFEPSPAAPDGGCFEMAVKAAAKQDPPAKFVTFEESPGGKALAEKRAADEKQAAAEKAAAEKAAAEKAEKAAAEEPTVPTPVQ